MGAEVIVPTRNLFARLRHRQIATLLLAVLKRFEEERPELGEHVQLIGETKV